jgi:deoxyribose-phosphate aldolase
VVIFSYVREELLAIGRNTEGFVRKVIIEAGYLNEEEKKLAVELIAESGMEFVKTSTGFFSQVPQKRMLDCFTLPQGVG